MYNVHCIVCVWQTAVVRVLCQLAGCEAGRDAQRAGRAFLLAAAKPAAARHHETHTARPALVCAETATLALAHERLCRLVLQKRQPNCVQLHVHVHVFVVY